MDTLDYVRQYVSSDWTPFYVTSFTEGVGREIIIAVSENTAEDFPNPAPTIMLTEIQVGRMFPTDPEVSETSILLDYRIAVNVAQAIATRQKTIAARTPRPDGGA